MLGPRSAATRRDVDEETRREWGALVADVRELLRYEEDLRGFLPEAGDAAQHRAGADAQRDVGLPSQDPSVQRASTQRASTQGPSSQGVSLEILTTEAASCTDCALHRGRTRSVFARGSATADLVFVGEGPGFHEDQQGRPFVGPAGKLLDRMISAMKFRPEDVYICNIVKCRPPQNRTPVPAEAEACARFLVPQLEAVAPRAMVALGRCAAENLGQTEPGGRGWRGRWGSFRGIPVMSTYHPAFLLRSPQFKRAVWEDLQSVMARLGNPEGA